MNVAEKNRSVVESAWHAIQADRWDEAGEHFANDYVRVTPAGIYSFDQFRDVLIAAHQAFAAERFVLDEVVADDERVGFHWELTARHHGEYLGVPATDRIVSFSGVTISRLRGGQIVKDQASWNRLGVLEALGIIPLDAR